MKNTLVLLSLLAMPALAADPTLYGRYEHIKIAEVGETFKAKMDTGALTASLSAKDIELFQRDGEQWVRFRLAADGASNKLFEHKVARVSKIKGRADEDDEDEDRIDPAKRPVVELQLCLGKQQRTVEVNLVDRSHFNYPLLIGAKALREFDAAVDPAKRYTAKQPDC
ncbi:zinc-protease sufamily protein [Pseudomonas sp. StFLB209]|uniref:retropepsin-like aspartic peptidase RloA2 n=1 Tax=Pseudomonas sp. StFLB209 TaxID=1028989 RepID=UPI0004F5E142|nr:ATP-dependent zinc protease [Pseudomonas sp. StFLB209]BAP42012.1 zinc-protease sufamily protein [Pseudomonas sp. StFLB209]